MARYFKLEGIKVKKGFSKEIKLKVFETFTSSPVYIPVTVIQGLYPGPTLFVTAAIHGDELNGIEIVRKLVSEIVPSRLHGTLVLIPILNPLAFNHLVRYLPDGRDLNRYFPGNPKGSSASQIAHIIFNKIIKQCNYGIDLHTATHGRINLPHVRGDLSVPEVKGFAKSFGAEIIFNHPGHKNSLRYCATQAGIPTILYEAGEHLKFQKNHIRKGFAGVIRSMNYLGMIDYTLKDEEPRYQIIVEKAKWLRADRGGILIMNVKPGQLVRKGEEIASCTKPFGKEVSEIIAPYDGLVISVTDIPVVTPGTAICHIFKLGEKKLIKIDTQIRRRSEEQHGVFE